MNFFNIFGNQKKTDNPNSSSSAPHQKTGPKTVLIVEDEELLANALEEKCKLAGLNVLKALNGQIGLESAIKNKPDIILLDLLMPVMDGKTMLHRLRALPEYKRIPVIILTNSGEVDNVKETTFYDNASAFFVKSNVSPEDIIRKINELI